jgi:hypothetical protein
MADVKFDDYTMKVIDAMNDKINAVLEECAGEMESAVKRNSRVATSQTKNSFQHHVDDEKHEAVVGSPLENAIWEELGTGEHALKGNGRKGGWYYVDEEGNGHFTHGKKPSRAFWHAYQSLKKPIQDRIQNALKGL